MRNVVQPAVEPIRPAVVTADECFGAAAAVGEPHTAMAARVAERANAAVVAAHARRADVPQHCERRTSRPAGSAADGQNGTGKRRSASISAPNRCCGSCNSPPARATFRCRCRWFCGRCDRVRAGYTAASSSSASIDARPEVVDCDDPPGREAPQDAWRQAGNGSPPCEIEPLNHSKFLIRLDITMYIPRSFFQARRDRSTPGASSLA